MRLLLTRAAEDSTRTRARLEAAGHVVLVSPVLVFATLDAPWPRSAPEGVIATSARAFSTALTQAASEIAPLPLYLVGTRTEAAARAHGFAGPAVVTSDGAALVATLQERPPMRLLYLAGRDRKPDIESGLAAAGYQLAVWETYQAVAAETFEPAALDALRAGSVDGVLHYSRRSAAIFLAVAARAGIDATRPQHFCLSPDVAVPLRHGRCPDILVASTPDEAGMLSLIG